MSHEIEPQVGSNLLRKPVPRRSVLKGVGLGVLAVASSACGLAGDKHKAVPTATLPAELPTPIDLTPSKTRVIDLDGAQVYLNSENLPEAFIGQDGVRVDLDVEVAREAREQAKILGEPEVFKMFRVDVQHINTTVLRAGFFEQHPVEPVLPKDTLTEAELLEHGIEIIQSDFTELFIRQGAFEAGELLSGYADSKRKLKFVMIDAEVVSRHYLKDAKFNSVREYSAQYEDVDVEGGKARMIEGYNSNIASNRKDRKEYGYETYYLSTLELKTYKYHLQHLMSAQELLDISIRSAQLKTDHLLIEGLYHQDTYDEKGNMTSPAVIFVAMGEPPESSDYLRIYFDKNGETVVDNFVNSAEGSHIALSNLQSYPGPDNLPRRPNIDKAHDSYILEADMPGERIRHESAHDFLIGYKKEPASEYGADEEVIASVTRARAEFDQTGNNGGYYFALRSKKSGDVILTQGKDKTAGGYRL